MWSIIDDDEKIKNFMADIGDFHDSVLKEVKYLSGAYVDEDLSMYPINDKRLLSVIIQCQQEKFAMIEMEFEDLSYLKLIPATPDFTCEILDASMFMADEKIYWCDSSGVTAENVYSYDGTVICAKKIRWRKIPNSLANKAFYQNIK